MLEPGEHDEYCHCEDCEGLARLHRHRPDSCLFDGDTLKGDGGYGPRQERQKKWVDRRTVIR